MAEENKSRLTEKRVDESWKESIQVEKDRASTSSEKKSSPPISFVEFVSSLGVQALMHLGEVENPVTRKREKNLDAARATIDLLMMLKDKTKGNLRPEEDSMLTELLADVQLRYVERAS